METHRYEIIQRQGSSDYHVNIIDRFNRRKSLWNATVELDRKYRNIEVIGKTLFNNEAQAKEYLNNFIKIIAGIETGKYPKRKNGVIESDSLQTFAVVENI
jgi:hypothetical protein